MIKRFLTRRTMARFLLPLVTFWAVIVPQQAYALSPQSIAVRAVMSGGAVSLNFADGAGLFLIGAGLGYLAVDYATAGVQESLRVQPGIIAVPPPPAAPTAPVIPPGSVRMDCFGYACPSQPQPTNGQACSTTEEPCTGGTFSMSQCLNSWSGPGGFTNRYCKGYVTTPASCPSGYTMSGSSCVLSDARTASPDHNCDYAKSGGSYAAITDPDCANAPLPTVQANGNHVWAGVGPNGQPARVEIGDNAAGGSCITTQMQKVVAGSTVVETVTVCTDADGNIISVTGGTQTGTVPTDGTAPTTGTEVPPIEFPSDYARSGEAQVAANTLAPKIDRIGDALTTTTTTTDPTEPLASDMPWFGTTFSALSGWTMPGHVSTCPTPSLDLSMVLGAGHVYVMSDHCALLADNQAPMRAAAIVGWMILALFVFLRA